MVERFPCKLKAYLRAADGLENWTDQAPSLVLFGIRSSVISDLHCYDAVIVFEATVRLIGQMISQNPRVKWRNLPTSSIFLDHFPRWTQAIPLPDIAAQIVVKHEATPLADIAAPTVVKALLSPRLAIFGTSSTITTDRGAQCESNLFQSLLPFIVQNVIQTTAYHPAANGKAVRFHRQLKGSQRPVDDPENWADHLPLLLLGIHSVLQPDLDYFTANLVICATF
nr:unnamed protein product [Spirometra erinaceieuropaei]